MWRQVAELITEDGVGEDRFGSSVAIDGDTVAVGAPNHNGPVAFDPWDEDFGVVYLFQRNAGGVNKWGQVAKLMANDGEYKDLFGVSLAISGNTVVVGAYTDSDDGLSSGSLYVFERNAGVANTWRQVVELTADDPDTQDHFGGAVAINGNTMVIGAKDDDDLGGASGSAYVFQRDQGNNNSWRQVAKLVVADGKAGDNFGTAVGIDHDTIVVGVPKVNAAYLFGRNIGGTILRGQIAKIKATDKQPV